VRVFERLRREEDFWRGAVEVEGTVCEGVRVVEFEREEVEEERSLRVKRRRRSFNAILLVMGFLSVSADGRGERVFQLRGRLCLYVD